MSKEHVSEQVEALQAAFEKLRETKQTPAEVSPYGVARTELLDALSRAVIAIGEYVIDNV